MSTIFRAIKEYTNGEKDAEQALGSCRGPLGSSGGSAVLMSGIMAITIMLLGIFVNSHAVYLKTGTPMFKLDLFRTFLQPFYSFYSAYTVFSVYALGAPSKAYSSFKMY